MIHDLEQLIDRAKNRDKLLLEMVRQLVRRVDRLEKLLGIKPYKKKK